MCLCPRTDSTAEAKDGRQGMTPTQTAESIEVATDAELQRQVALFRIKLPRKISPDDA